MSYNLKFGEKLMTEEELKGLASQLRCPAGGDGVRVGQMMKEGNRGMVLRTLEEVGKEAPSQVLEIGFGSGFHITEMLEKFSEMNYVGVEISETMIEEARLANAKSEIVKRMSLLKTDGKTLPFEAATFDKVFSVNTLYFWGDVKSYAAEIHRVIKPQGEFLLAFASKEFMQKLPFTRFDFNLYDLNDVVDIFSEVGFLGENVIEEIEDVRSKTGDWVKRQFYVVKFSKD